MNITDGLLQQTKKWILKMAQYGELSHFIFNSKTDTKGNTNLDAFSKYIFGFCDRERNPLAAFAVFISFYIMRFV